MNTCDSILKRVLWLKQPQKKKKKKKKKELNIQLIIFIVDECETLSAVTNANWK